MLSYHSGMKTYLACFTDLLVFIILIKYVNSTHKFDKNQVSSQKVDLSSELQKSSEFKYRARRDGTCHKRHDVTVDPPLNEFDEEKDYIRVRWMEGDKVIMIAYDEPTVTTLTNTSVWLIDATVPTSLDIKELHSIEQTILTVVVNPANKDNVVLIAADRKTLYIMMGGMVVKKKTFPNALSLTNAQLLDDIELASYLFHPTNPSYITVVSGNRFYYSTDLGYQWLEGPENVVRYQWGENDTLFYGIGKDSNSYYLTLYRTDDLFKTQKFLQAYVYSFVFNKILFISKSDGNDETNLSRMIWVSSDNGDHFTQTRVPSAAPEQTYRVMAVTVHYAMLHFRNASPSGQLYISDSKFTSYTLSLYECLVTAFYQVQSMRGVYIASVLVQDKRIKTLITYNAGAEWNTISHVDCQSTTKECQLNLYITDYFNRNVEEAQSSENAKGLILAHGMIGPYLNLTSNLEMYMSSDGGYRWERSPDSHFTLGNFGNLIVSVSPDLIGGGCRPISSVRYRQGDCWGEVPASIFSGFKYCGFTMEPGASSLRTFVWGYQIDSNKWAFYVIDFQSALDRVCSSEDFEAFIPHALTGCLLGFNETFQRVKRDSYCFIASDEAKLSFRKVNPCKCYKDHDFDCDFGYERKPGPNTTCFPIPGYEVAQHCLLGEDTYEYNELGLRLIPGDLCLNPDKFLNTVNKSCSNWDKTINNLVNFLQSHQNGSIAAGVVVLFILLFCIFLACFFVARMWLRRTKTKEPIAYMSLLNATEEEDNSLIESDLEKETKDEDDCEPLEV